MEKESKKNKKVLKITIIAILIIAIIVAIVLIVSKILNIKKVGNTVGNIRNFGYAAEDDKYIYYMAPDAEGKLKALNRIDKKLDKDPEQLIAGDWDLMGINVYNDYLYFITLSLTSNEKDMVDNKIHRMKIDGSEHDVINNNKFHNSCYEMYVIKDKIYYIGEDEGIYTMNLDGSEKTRLGKTETGFVAIDKKYILYNDYANAEKEEFATYIMQIDGTDKKKVLDRYLYAPTVIDEYVYYLDEECHIYRVELGKKDYQMLSSIASYCVNVTNDGVYSLKFLDADLTKQGIFKMNLDGTDEELIKELNSTSQFLAVLDDWIVYMDETDTKGIIAMVSKDGKKYQELYSLDFSNYLENVDSEELMENIDMEKLEEYVNEMNAQENVVTE